MLPFCFESVAIFALGFILSLQAIINVATNVGVLPVSGLTLATLTTLVFMGSWRQFLWPLVVIHSMEKMTLPVGIAAFQGLYSTDWPLLMAASTVALLPMLLLFVFNQRFFVEGIKLSGLKQ